MMWKLPPVIFVNDKLYLVGILKKLFFSILYNFSKCVEKLCASWVKTVIFSKNVFAH